MDPARHPATDRQIPPRDLAVATHDGARAHPQSQGPACGCPGEDRSVAACCGQDALPSPESAAQAPMVVYPPLRRLVERSESTVLRRPADGPRLPARLRRWTALTQGDGESLDAARTDVGCRASA